MLMMVVDLPLVLLSTFFNGIEQISHPLTCHSADTDSLDDTDNISNHPTIGDHVASPLVVSSELVRLQLDLTSPMTLSGLS
jgi:hypothetical protein